MKTMKAGRNVQPPPLPEDAVFTKAIDDVRTLIKGFVIKVLSNTEKDRASVTTS